MPRPRENRDIKKGFIWIPRDGPLISDIKIDGVSVKDDVLDAVFHKGLCPEIGYFSIRLFNADGKYSELYGGGESVQFFMDRGRTAKLLEVTGEAKETTIQEGTDIL